MFKGGKVKKNPLIRISDQIYDVMTTPRLIKETDFNKLSLNTNLQQMNY